MEDPLDSSYAIYATDRSPQALGAVVEHLKPTLQYSLGSLGSSDDPFMRGQARVIAGAAVKSYDPASGASLRTWVSQNMQRLYRIRRQSQAPVKLPDRALLDHMSIERGEREYLDKHGRDPDATELADHIKIPVKRITAVRNMMRRVPSESAVGDAPTLTGQTEHDSAMLDEAVHYVHEDADSVDRRILEMKTGFGGKYPLMDPIAIGLKLNLSPSQLSRRSARLAEKIAGAHGDLQATT